MCMICKGLKNNKLSVEEARERYEEMIDLIDEDHQETIENLLAEAEEELNYWDTTNKIVRDEYYEDDDIAIDEQLEEIEEPEEDSYDDE
jgi:hypothetical protein